MNKKYILIQSRLSSSRFPKKMLHNVLNTPLVKYVYNRCKQSKLADGVVVITSSEKSDDELYEFCKKNNLLVFRGDLNNVFKRYLNAAENYNSSIICRVCGDSPFVDVDAIDNMFTEFEQERHLDYMSTVNSLNGFMSEVFTLDLLKKVYNCVLSSEDKEHVTKYIRDNISCFNVKQLNLKLRPTELEKFSLTVDFPEDIVVVEKIVKNLDSYDFTSTDIINILNSMKEDNEL